MPHPTDLQINHVMACRIRGARIGLGASGPTFADMIGVQPQDLQAYETGRHLVPAIVLLRVAKQTGFQIDWFFRSVLEREETADPLRTAHRESQRAIARAEDEAREMVGEALT